MTADELNASGTHQRNRKFDGAFNSRLNQREETSMPRGSKAKYTKKQKRKARHIEKGYERRGVSSREAARRAWATVNNESGGGKKKGGSGRGKKRSHASSRKGGKLGGRASARRSAAARSASARKAARTRKRRGH
jgi:hypothetical protein